MKKIIKLLFGMEEQVTRIPYVVTGFILIAIKYAGEAALYYSIKGALFLPEQFFSPLFTGRFPGYKQFPDWFFWAIILWNLPFIWVGTGMSIRRAANAGYSPWAGLLFLLPITNYGVILALSLLPPAPVSRWQDQEKEGAAKRIYSPMVIVLVFTAIAAIVGYVSSNLFKSYGVALFAAYPLFLGLIQGFVLNYKQRIPFRKTFTLVGITLLLANLVFLLFALEGVICLMMAMPLGLPLALLGGWLGACIAIHSRDVSLTSPMFLLLTLPVLPAVEQQFVQPYEDMVLSVIEIDAKPEQIFPNVVKFSDLPPTDYWLFKLGVAHPLRARIDGTGVGAVRYCEFSTGAFVEPITAWEAPNRLAFDVKFQPEPMKELTFYDSVDAPHLHGYFRSVRREFRIIPLANGKTRLEGRTWYEMDMFPGWYWQNYGRFFIHKIHLRVLNHIKGLSENQVAVAE